jgi:glycosyltransferase involved in cell wall biosynthesis
MPPAIDLVLATVGRTQELARFLRALDAQTFRDFRLIVADQNCDGRLSPLLASFESAYPIIHLRVEPGLSRARNIALKRIEAEVVAFPDDDCWYPPDLLERVASLLSGHPEWDGVGGRAVDDVGKPAAGQLDAGAGAMTILNVWQRVATYTLFLRRRLIDAVGAFDEQLGPGSGTRWGAAEDLDYIARSLRAGCSVYYDPTLNVHHPQTREQSPRPEASQGYEYGAGLGRTLRKNGLPWWFAGYYVVRSFGASALSLLAGHPRRSRFYWAVGRGRVRGWWSESRGLRQTGTPRTIVPRVPGDQELCDVGSEKPDATRDGE